MILIGALQGMSVTYAPDGAARAEGNKPNPHWRTDACNACHRDGEKASRGSLISHDIDAGCKDCHQADENHAIIHPIALKPTDNMKKNMSPSFLKSLDARGRTGCVSCHDILIQCDRKQHLFKRSNATFLRAGPYRSRTGVCYQCHDKAGHQRLNAHDQISDSGELNEQRCLICHRQMPQQDAAGKSRNAALRIDVDRKEICLNCHKWRPHPGGDMSIFRKGTPEHLVVPPADIKKHIDRVNSRGKIILPLEPRTGKLYCATCHNPHERGVIKDKRRARGADENNRLRMQKICRNCHVK